jgi:glucosamine-6-phosphate deaminase
MEVVVLHTAREASTAVARVVAALVRRKPQAVLGLPTGETPKHVYAELARLHREEGLDFARVTTFNLDEYVGLPTDHPGSFHRYMAEHLFCHVNLAPARAHVPDGNAPDLARACASYEDRIRQAGGMDLALLGLGEDGHVAYNEPSSSLASRTRIKTLTPATRAAIAERFAPEAAPRHVITMGVGTIVDARRCLLLALGPRKAAAVARMVEGPVTAMVPASALQFHPRTTVVVDEDAARGLALLDYYREVHRDKPAWQRDEDGV